MVRAWRRSWRRCPGREPVVYKDESPWCCEAGVRPLRPMRRGQVAHSTANTNATGPLTPFVALDLRRGRHFTGGYALSLWTDRQKCMAFPIIKLHILVLLFGCYWQILGEGNDETFSCCGFLRFITAQRVCERKQLQSLISVVVQYQTLKQRPVRALYRAKLSPTTKGNVDLTTIPAFAITEIHHGQDVHRGVEAAIWFAMVSLEVGERLRNSTQS
jgi:hypothetical protein